MRVLWQGFCDRLIRSADAGPDSGKTADLTLSELMVSAAVSHPNIVMFMGLCRGALPQAEVQGEFLWLLME